MKKTFLSGLTIVLLTTMANAQTPNFTVGPELEGANRPISINLHDDNLSFFAGDVASGFAGNKDLNFFKLDLNTLAPILNKTNLIQLKFKEYTFDGLFYFPDREFVLYSSEVSNDEIKLKYQLLETGSQPPFELQTVNMGKKKYPKDKPVSSFFGYNTYESLYNQYHLSLSPNKQKFLYIDNIPLINHQNPDRVPEARLVVMNAKDLKIEKEVAFDLGIINYGFGVLFGNNNFAYSLVKVIPDKVDKENYYYKLIGLSLKNGVPDFEYELKFPGKKIESIEINLASNGDVLCGGGYSELTDKRKSQNIDGVFFARVNGETGKAIAEGISPLDEKYVAFIGGTFKGNKVQGVSSEFFFKEAVELENGMVNLLFEEYEFTAKGGFYRSILVVNLNTAGKVNWMKAIAKNQFQEEGCDYHFTSFTHHVEGNKISFVFTDDKNNYDANTKLLLDKYKVSEAKMNEAKRKSATVAIATINEKGEVVQKILAETGKYSCYSIGAKWNNTGSEIFFLAKKSSGRHCVAKIKLN